MPHLLRITTVPISLKLLITGQMKFMSDKGYKVIMVSADGPEREEVIQSEGCEHIIVPMTRAITPLQDLKCLWQLYKIMRKYKPSIVHTHTPKAGLLGMWAAKLAGIEHRLHTVAGMPLMTADRFKKKLLFFIEKITYRAAHLVLPNSRSLKDYILDHSMASKAKVQMIGHGSSNGIDLSKFSAESLTQDILEKTKKDISYNPSLTYLLAVGRIVVDKGIIELVEVFNELYQKNNALRLILLGPMEKERAEETLPTETAHRIEGHPGIIHIQWSDHVEYFMHLADLLIHASHREGFPNVPLQAGAMECPIVCSAIPGNIDIVENEVTGLTYPVGNAKNLQATLQKALSDFPTMKNMAKTLRLQVETKYDRHIVHQELLQQYQLLLSKRKA